MPCNSIEELDWRIKALEKASTEHGASLLSLAIKYGARLSVLEQQMEEAKDES